MSSNCFTFISLVLIGTESWLSPEGVLGPSAFSLPFSFPAPVSLPWVGIIGLFLDWQSSSPSSPSRWHFSEVFPLAQPLSIPKLCINSHSHEDSPLSYQFGENLPPWYLQALKGFIYCLSPDRPFPPLIIKLLIIKSFPRKERKKTLKNEERRELFLPSILQIWVKKTHTASYIFLKLKRRGKSRRKQSAHISVIFLPYYFCS